MEQNKEIAVGLRKGHKTTKIVPKSKRKGVSCFHVKLLVLNGSLASHQSLYLEVVVVAQ